MDCPTCRGREFELKVVLTGDVRCRFQDRDVQLVGDAVSFDSDWDPESPCRCLACGWEGKASDVINGKQQSGRSPRSTQLSDATLAEMQREIDSDDCPPQLREPVRALLAELKLLRARLDVVQRATKSQRIGGERGDTALI